MSVLDARKTYRNLKKKGFVDSILRSYDHKYLELFHNNKLVCYTKLSHGIKDIGSFLIKQMSFQCHLNKKEFMDLCNCPLNQNDYLKILKEKGLLE